MGGYISGIDDPALDFGITQTLALSIIDDLNQLQGA
jgi:hypothetical protein